MLPVTFSTHNQDQLSILCLGAHSDDIEIGCGGSMLRLIKGYPNLEVVWTVFGANQEQRASEALASATAFLSPVRMRKIIIKGYRDSFFPYIGEEIKEYFEELKALVNPDLIFTHYRHDLHQDHRLISDLTWNTFRDHLVLEYEIPKYDGDLSSPNFFIPLNKEICHEKVDLLLDHFKTQQYRQWFSKETFLSLMRIRGYECNAADNYAEAFYVRKMVY